jgi:hypothetical protein
MNGAFQIRDRKRRLSQTSKDKSKQNVWNISSPKYVVERVLYEEISDLIQ